MSPDQKRPDVITIVLATLAVGVAGMSMVWIGIFGHRGWLETVALVLSLIPFVCRYNEEWKERD